MANNFFVVGLGNPGDEYDSTRHNTGRMALFELAKNIEADEFVFDKKINALISKGKIKSSIITLIEPETFMNKSGSSLIKIIKTKRVGKTKTADNLIVIYDDFNLPLGNMRISYNRSSGGHNGLESIIKSIGTEAFIRIRIGISSSNKDGHAKIPHGDDKIEKFILGKYKEEELKELKKVFKKACLAIQTIILEGREKAMSIFNQ